MKTLPTTPREGARFYMLSMSASLLSVAACLHLGVGAAMDGRWLGAVITLAAALAAAIQYVRGLRIYSQCLAQECERAHLQGRFEALRLVAARGAAPSRDRWGDEPWPQ